MRTLLLRLLSACGVLAAARYITRKRLRILCYHGISIGDQHEYEPLLFMRAAVFERRIQALKARRWRIVDLDTAVDELRLGTLGENTLVVTIDDGWLSTLKQAAPLLYKYSVPATVYVTTYYAQRPADVFNVSVYYMLWKSRERRIVLDVGDSVMDGEYDLEKDRSAIARKWIDRAERVMTWQQRQIFLTQVAQVLRLSEREVFADGRFRIANEAEIRRLHESGLDVQLHTHRHRLPNESREALAKEIADNREVLQDAVPKAYEHFCYPSGIYTDQQSEWLGDVGLKSSTTCDFGLNRLGAHPHRLRRILDRDNWSDLDFEFFLSGLSDIFGVRGGGVRR